MKLQRILANKKQKVRFGAIGIVNTAVDFGLYSVLSYVAGLPLIIANLISTSAGFIVSFFLNRKFTFDSKNERKLHEFFRFLATTLVGLWIIQPLIIYYCKTLFTLFHFSGIWTVVLPKAAAILVGLVWNYLWYANFVFVKKRPELVRPAYQYLKRTMLAFRQSDFFIPLIVAVTWQLTMTLLGMMIQYMFTRTFLDPQHFDLSIASAGPLQHTEIWDGGWFRFVATDFYRHSITAPAFYPLFPVAVRTVEFLFLNRLAILLCGLILNTACLWLGLTALLKITRVVLGTTKDVAWIYVLFLSFPAAFFLHQFYSEAIFIAFGFWAYYFALKRVWFASSICLLFLSATRVTAVLFIALVLLEYWRAHGWHLKKALLNPRILWFALAPLGFIAYGTYLLIVRRDFLAMFHAYRYDWKYQKLNLHFWHILHIAASSSYHCTVTKFAACNVTDNFVNLMLPLVCLVILGILSVLAIFYLRGIFIPLGSMGLLSCLMFTLNSNLVSVHRYILPILTLYLVLVALIRKWKLPPWTLFPLIQIGFAIQMLLFLMFINVYFVG